MRFLSYCFYNLTTIILLRKSTKCLKASHVRQLLNIYLNNVAILDILIHKNILPSYTYCDRIVIRICALHLTYLIQKELPRRSLSRANNHVNALNVERELIRFYLISTFYKAGLSILPKTIPSAFAGNRSNENGISLSTTV